jgi:hypothetical protein
MPDNRLSPSKIRPAADDIQAVPRKIAKRAAAKKARRAFIESSGKLVLRLKAKFG